MKFLCLPSKLKLGNMLCGLFTISFVNTIHAQQAEKIFPDIEIKTNRIKTTARTSAKNIGTLDKKEITQLPGTSPNQWLSMLNGVDIRQRGAEGVQADIGIRGGSFDQTLILLNGIKLNDAQTGHHSLNLPFTSEAIKQIEVIKNAASRVYGINAMAGAVNFVTQVPDNNQVYAGVFAGDFGLTGLKIGIANHYKNIGQHISYAQQSSIGYKPNSDFNNKQLFYQAAIVGKNKELNFTAGYSNRAFGASGFYAPNSTEYEKVETAFGAIQFEHTIHQWNIKSQVYYRYNQDDYVYKRANPSYYHNKHFTHTEGAEIHATYKSSFGITGLGIDSKIEHISSNNLGTHSRNLFGFYAEHSFKFFENKLSLNPGIYMNAYAGNQLAIFPGIDGSFTLNKNLLLFASIDKGMRLPTYTDLYYNGYNNIGNPNLKPETVVSSEVGFKSTKNNKRWSASVFNKNTNNLIDWTKKDITQKWEPLNIQQVTTRGIELSAGISVNKVIKLLSAQYTYMNSYLHRGDVFASQYALSNIKHQVIGNFMFEWFPHLTHTITLRHINRVTMTDYTLFDTKLAYTYKNISVYTDISNLFNVNYMEAGYVTMPGRWFKVGLEAKLAY